MRRIVNDKYPEFCHCGGMACIHHYESQIPILKCKVCGDEFEAHEDSWIVDDEKIIEAF